MQADTISKLHREYGIGLTGGVATGKSTVAQLIRDAGWPVADADRFARDVVEPGTPGLAAVAEEFGQRVLASDGKLNRSALGEIVFDNVDRREQLESILHPLIQARLTDWLDQSGLIHAPKIWFYEAALLFEKERTQRFHQIWVTYCPVETQIQRLQSRNHVTRDVAEKIIASQLPAKHKADRAHVVFNTACDMVDLKQQVTTALAKLSA